jgi:ATP-dependent helicase/nuclease subunit A
MSDPFERIRESLDESLFVEAGAGTGKTKALVDRLVALVRSGRPINAIVAITFTEKAAAELRERVRIELEQAAGLGDARGYIGAALEALDAAPISTIHAFAAGLVRSFAAEAGVDPDFAILDEVAAQRRFQQAWRERLEQLGDNETARDTFARVLRLGLLPTQIETLAWELWPRPDLARQVLEIGPGAPAPWPDFTEPQRTLGQIRMDNKPDDDRLAVRLKRLRGLVDLLVAAASPAEREALLAANGLQDVSFNVSNAQIWPLKASIVATATAIRNTLTDLLAHLRDEALRAILPYVARFVLDDRAARCRDGSLTYDDLIGITRDLLTEDRPVRQRFRDRYQALLIDEFQDTDPWQFDIARAFAADPETGNYDPGRLFLVGDPKQSIYRFRKADMAIYAAAKGELGRVGEPVSLVDCHRSTPTIVDWVNALFSRMFAGFADETISPPYRAMAAVRSDHPTGPPVSRIGGMLDTLAAPARRAEAEHLASVCLSVVNDGWQVSDRADEDFRSARFRDIAILMPSRTALPDIERALEQARIPFRVESGSLVFQTQEVRDLVNILAAIDDPADQVAVVAALRSPGLACSDVELARHKLGNGTFNYLSPANPPGPVTDALGRLRRFHDERPSRSIADLTQAVLADTGIVASAILDTRDRDAFRRARFVVEQARTFEADGPQSVRAFVDWLEERSSRPIINHEGAALDEDEDAVRILTVHGAKGLEFPVVIMAGFGTNPRAASAPAFAVEPTTGQLAVCIGSKSRGTRFAVGPVDAIEALERSHDEAERLRVLYVAATRARDHLVVSLYHSAKSTTCAARKLQDAGAANSIPELEQGAITTVAAGPLAGIAVDLPTAATPEEAADERAALVAASKRLIVTSATALGGGKDARGDDTEPWSHGRGSTRLGRAVHAVIQSVPMDAPAGAIAAFARAQAVAEAIPDREPDVIRLAERAFSSGVAARARAARRALREVPFAFEDESGAIVEGFVDLLIEDDEGIEIVDWKTDDITSEEVARRIEQYRLQAGLYILGLERATGSRVKGVTYVFLSPQVELALDDLDGLTAFARERLAQPR